jgi:hypothetical protein
VIGALRGLGAVPGERLRDALVGAIRQPGGVAL